MWISGLFFLFEHRALALCIPQPSHLLFPSKCPLPGPMCIQHSAQIKGGSPPPLETLQPLTTLTRKECCSAAYSYSTQCTSYCTHSTRLLSCISLLDLRRPKNRNLRRFLLQLQGQAIEKSLHGPVKEHETKRGIQPF